MSKNQVVIIVVILLVVVGVGFWAKKMNKEDGYSVVYMTTGEVYIGKLSSFPDFELTDAYIFQVTKDVTDETKANFQLQPIKEALWAPKSMHLVKDNVVFYGPLMSNSKIAETIAGQGK